MTNAERIRRMSNEKFAEQLSDWMDCTYCPMYNRCNDASIFQCREKLREWLATAPEEEELTCTT